MKKKKIIIISFIICLIITVSIFCGYKLKQYKIKQLETFELAKEILSQINYVKMLDDKYRYIEPDKESLDFITATLKKTDELKIMRGFKPGLYKTRQDVTAVLRDGTEVDIYLYTGDWSFSIETIKDWHFKTGCWLQPATFENDLN